MSSLSRRGFLRTGPAAGGIRFERCYSAPLCGPTRCEINTGRYAFRTGGLTNPTAGRPKSQDEYPLARILKEAGYDTCSAGKWRQMGETPREWIFVQPGSRWYVRDDGWKLNRAGELFDMKDAPFVEQAVPADAKDEAAIAARQRLQAVLDKLDPAGGKTISPEEGAAAKNRAKKQQQKQGQKKGRKKAKAGQEAQTQ